MTELLSPAGSLKMLQYAFAYGADAVYAGLPRYSLRVRNNEFNHSILQKGIDLAHSLGKKIYTVVNISPHNSKLKTFLDDIEKVASMKPDAFIMSDPGLINLVHKNFPQIDIHLSVQANAVNWATVEFWKDFGVKRVILSRELSISEISEIKFKVPEIELEVFVHGALCMAYSGRCLLSGYINHRDSNQGACTNACRWEYKELKSEFDDKDDLVLSDKSILVVEPKKPNDHIPMYEDIHGTYIMNSKDLNAIELVPELMKIGVSSLKIEGRTKSPFYCARATQVYRRAIDNVLSGKDFDLSLLKDLDSLANRGYTEGFLRRHSHDSYQNYLTGSSLNTRQQFVGEFSGEVKNGLAEIIVKNKFEVGNKIEIMTVKFNQILILKKIYDKKGNFINVAPGDGHIVYIPFDNIDIQYALIMKFL